MSDATPCAAKSEPERVSADEGISSHHDELQSAFLELAHDLEPYVLEHLPWEPAFHRFPDLPIELRGKTYEEYYLDNEGCLTTSTSPALDWSPIFTIRNCESRDLSCSCQVSASPVRQLWKRPPLSFSVLLFLSSKIPMPLYTSSRKHRASRAPDSRRTQHPQAQARRCQCNGLESL